MSLTIRDATAADLDFIVCANASMAAETEGLTLDLELVRPGVAAVLADPALGRYFIAEKRSGDAGATPVGQLLLTYEWSDWRNGVFWWIQSVYVLAGQRGAGVFTGIFRHVEAAARRDPRVCGLRLYVDRHNADARSIYTHLGLHVSNYDIMENVFRGPASRRED